MHDDNFVLQVQPNQLITPKNLQPTTQASKQAEPPKLTSFVKSMTKKSGPRFFGTAVASVVCFALIPVTAGFSAIPGAILAVGSLIGFLKNLNSIRKPEIKAIAEHHAKKSENAGQNNATANRENKSPRPQMVSNPEMVKASADLESDLVVTRQTNAKAERPETTYESPWNTEDLTTNIGIIAAANRENKSFGPRMVSNPEMIKAMTADFVKDLAVAKQTNAKAGEEEEEDLYTIPSPRFKNSAAKGDKDFNPQIERATAENLATRLVANGYKSSGGRFKELSPSF